MTQFSHLKGLRVEDDALAEFVFYGIAGEPSLTVRPAGDSNKEFFNAVLLQSKAAQRKARGRKNKLPTIQTIEAARKEDIGLFVQYIVIGWKGVLDSEGNEVEFSADVCEQFLYAIPPDMFSELRNFCLDIDNFRADTLRMAPEELEELQGN